MDLSAVTSPVATLIKEIVFAPAIQFDPQLLGAYLVVLTSYLQKGLSLEVVSAALHSLLLSPSPEQSTNNPRSLPYTPFRDPKIAQVVFKATRGPPNRRMDPQDRHSTQPALGRAIHKPTVPLRNVHIMYHLPQNRPHRRPMPVGIPSARGGNSPRLVNNSLRERRARHHARTPLALIQDLAHQHQPNQATICLSTTQAFANALAQKALHPNTARNYLSTRHAYVKLCNTLNVDPADPTSCALFLAERAKTVFHGTLLVDRSAIRDAYPSTANPGSTGYKLSNDVLRGAQRLLQPMPATDVSIITLDHM